MGDKVTSQSIAALGQALRDGRLPRGVKIGDAHVQCKFA